MSKSRDRRFPLFDGSPKEWQSWKKFMMARFLPADAQIDIILSVSAYRKALSNNGNTKYPPQDFKSEETKASRAIYSGLFECVTKAVLKTFHEVEFGDGFGAWLALLNDYERPSNASIRKLYFEPLCCPLPSLFQTISFGINSLLTI